MSVAQAMGGDAWAPGAGSRAARYYHGLRLGDVGNFQQEASTRDAGNSEDGRSEGIHGVTYNTFPKPTGPGLNSSQLANMDHLMDPRLARQGRQELKGHHVQGSLNGGEEMSKTNDPGFAVDTQSNARIPLQTENKYSSFSESYFGNHHQQDIHHHHVSPSSQRLSPREMEEYKTKLEEVSREKKLAKQQREAEILKYQVPLELGNRNLEQRIPYAPAEYRGYSNINERRSLDLENTKGGAGAPIKNPWGKNVTRIPITLRRDDYGESVIKEDIPGKATFDLDFTNEESKLYFPWSSPGGGAPIKDKNGNIITKVYGKLEGRIGSEDDVWRSKRRQELLNKELKEGIRQHKENKDEFTRYMKAPQGDLAEVLLAGRVGKPRRDEVTGEMVHQHLPNSDVSKLKMNYQPVPLAEKISYRDELIRMAEERQYQKQLEKLKERQETNAHFKNMDSAWGAFGGGAPKHEVIRRKANLLNSLFYSEQPPEAQYSRREDYVPPTGLGSFEYNQSPLASYQNVSAGDETGHHLPTPNSTGHMKASNRSSHKNLFDLGANQRSKEPGQYWLAPYATGRS